MSKLFRLGQHLVGQACQIQGRRPQNLRIVRSFSSSTVPPEVIDPESHEPWIPPYTPREGEPIEILKARLLYQSRKRGMLENGLLLSTFAAKHLDSMNEAELKDYDRLINLPSNDWDIFYWATGVKPIPIDFDTPVMKKFIAHVKNEDREQRLRQPDLYVQQQ